MKKEKFSVDIILTFATSIATMVLSVMQYGVIARNFSSDGLSQYMLIKRVTTVASPCIMLGFPLALTRYLAISEEKSNKNRYQYMFAASTPLFIMFMILFLLVININEEIGSYVLGNAWDELKIPMFLLLLGLAVYSQVYAYFRGVLSFWMANILTIINMGIIPIVLFGFFSYVKISQLISINGIMYIFFSILFFMIEFRKNYEKENIFTLNSFKMKFRELAKYGLPRVPSFFISGLLLSISTILLAKNNDLLGVASITAGLNIIFTASGLVSPIGIVLLPKGSELIAKGRTKELSNIAKQLIVISVSCGLFILMQWIVIGKDILNFWLKFNSSDVLIPAMIVSTALPFYMLYEILRNVLDAISIKPINTISQLISIIILLGAHFILILSNNKLANTVAISTTLALIMLGMLTALFVIKLLKINFLKRDIIQVIYCILINVAFMFISSLTARLCTDLSITLKIIIYAVIELLIFSGYIFVLYCLKIEWVTKILEKLRLVIKHILVAK